MSEQGRIDWGLVTFIAFCVTVGLTIGLFLFSVDTDEWDETEDPACYQRTQADNRVFGQDSTTITRYCEVAS